MRLVKRLAVAIVCFGLAGSVLGGTYSGGAGTQEDPYKIGTVEDWQELIGASGDWDKCFVLVNDIDFGGMELTPVAPDTDPVEYYFQGIPFTGVFDGNGHILGNSVITLPDNDYVGLFGFLGSGGQIRNLGVENITVSGRYSVGGLCGANGEYWESIDGGTIRGCYATGTVSGDGSVGGLCGGDNFGTISDCYATGTVSGDGIVGGLCGENFGTISDCYATGKVSSNYSFVAYVGGLCGSNHQGTISDCYATGAVSGYRCVGGLCGSNYQGTISNCFATGAVSAVSGADQIGGLCGSNGGMISKSFATGRVRAINYYWNPTRFGGLCGDNGGTISACYATGSVTGHPENIGGGLCGANYDTISNCYARGVVSRGGGLCGENRGGTISDCFWDIETSGQTSSAGGEGKTTAEMKTLSTFTDAGWDFSYSDGDPAVWRMSPNEYPRLVWQKGYSGGSGMAEDPYRISTIADWQELIGASGDWDKCFVLMNDIDFSGVSFPTIAPDTDLGTEGFQGTPFSGIFEGNGHVLRNISRSTGPFGHVNSVGEIRNLGIEDIYIWGDLNAAGLCSINDGLITDCYVSGKIHGGGYDQWIIGGLCSVNNGIIISCHTTGTIEFHYPTGSLGGLCGSNNCILSNCYSSSNISGSLMMGSFPDRSLGGLCGINTMRGTIKQCYASGSVSGNYDFVGGLCGANKYGSSIRDSYATGTVSADSHVGGLCGANGNRWTFGGGMIQNCYATGTIRGGDYLGGLCGENSNGLITSCYASGSVSGQSNVGGLCGYGGGTINNSFWDMDTSGITTSVGGEGKTTDEMQTLSTFTDASWDFVGESANGTIDTWRMCVNDVDYPRLSWEFSQGGDFDCPNGVDLNDLLYLSARWLETTPTKVGAADSTFDGKANLADFAILSENWLQNIP